MSLLEGGEGQGENGSAYRAGATVLTVPLSDPASRNNNYLSRVL